MAEKEKLGILVPTNNNLDRLIGVTRAAKKAGKQVLIFFTHDGILMTLDQNYQELVDLEPDQISLCSARRDELGLGDAPVPAGMELDDLATQSRHVALIEACDRYLVL
jgi:hypothetical protein